MCQVTLHQKSARSTTYHDVRVVYEDPVLEFFYFTVDLFNYGAFFT